MKKLLHLVLMVVLCVLAAAAHATSCTAPCVQTNATPAGGASSIALSGVSASDVLILLISKGATLTTPTGFTALNVPAAYTANSLTVNTGVYINTSPAAGTNTVTLQANTVGAIIEMSNVAPSPVDINAASANNTGTSGSSTTTVSVPALAQVQEVAFGMLREETSGAGTRISGSPIRQLGIPRSRLAKTPASLRGGRFATK
jgi:hypothetical protein